MDDPIKYEAVIKMADSVHLREVEITIYSTTIAEVIADIKKIQEEVKA